MKIVNIKKNKCTHYCGREESYDPENENHGKNFSVFGNPFKVKPWGEYTREESVAKHKIWLNEQRKKRSKAWISLLLLPQDAVLGCFCYPLSCHCDNLKAAYEWADKSGEREKAVKMAKFIVSLKGKKQKVHNGKISKLKDNQVFVFGANQQGFHGAGSAGFASFNKWGNHWREHEYDKKPKGWKGLWNEKGKIGAMVGTEGKSYGLVTVTRAGEKRSLNEDQMVSNIQDLYNVANKRPNLEFLVAQSHEAGLNGYSGEEMAEFFVKAGSIPENVIFQKEFYDLILDLL